MAELYLWIKAAHVIAVIAWMAGMFYLPRLFVHHAERAAAGSELSETLKMMERKLYRVIMGPAMIATWVLGLILVALSWQTVLASGWFWVKFAAVMAMSGLHGWLGTRLREFTADANTRSGRTYRIVNEVPTVLLIAIVIMVIVQPF